MARSAREKVFALLLGASLCSAGQFHSDRAVAQVTLTEKEIGTIQPGILPQTMTSTPSADAFAYIAVSGGKAVVVTKDGASATYDSVDARSVRLYPGGLAFTARRGGDHFLVNRGTETKLAGELIFNGFVPSPLVSPDGKRIALALRRGGKEFVSVDGVEGPMFDQIATMAFTATSQIVYSAKRDGKVSIVKEGIEAGPFDSAGAPMTSADGSSIAFQIRRTDGSVWRVNGTDGRTYKVLMEGVFSNDGKQFAYTAPIGTGVGIVLNEKEGSAFDSIGPPGLFSPNGTKHAYVAGGKDNRLFVVLNGVVQKNTYELIADLTFSPDSQRLAFVAGNKNKRFVVVDGVAGKSYDKIEERSLRFSPDSKEIVYLVPAGTTQLRVVRNKTVLKTMRNVSQPHFTPDSKHLVYTGSTSNASHIMFDAKSFGQFDSFVGPARSTSFPEPGKFRLLARRAGKVIQVDATFK